MKKMILGFILGLVVAGGIGVLAYTITADKIGYSPKDSSWKVTNVNDAINDLKQNNDSEKTIKQNMYTNQSLQIILPNHTLETTDSNIVSVDNNGTVNAVGIGNAKVKVIDNNSKVSLIYDITVTYSQPIEFYATSDSNFVSYNTNEVQIDNVNSYLFDGIATSRQGRYGALMLKGKAYFKVYEKVNVTFSSAYYSDSGGSSGKNATFYKKDSSGNYIEYYVLKQLNNTQNYGKYTFEPGEYYVESSSLYVTFDEWTVEKY